jgi:hypothetical protein
MAVTIKRTIEVEHEVSPAEVARLFSEMADHEQALVLSEISRLFSEWPGSGETQCLGIAKKMNPFAIEWMQSVLKFVEE